MKISDNSTSQSLKIVNDMEQRQYLHLRFHQADYPLV